MNAAPALTVSTNLLVADIIQDVAEVSCTPSDPLAPVRWRTVMGTYSELSTDYQVTFSQNAQLATFSLLVYEGQPPARTEVFVCDLINVDQPVSMEVDPQTVNVRFLTSELRTLLTLFSVNKCCLFTQLTVT